MAYTESEARKLIIQAGLELVKKELVARTWGNISAKISDTEFIITPSGKAYEDLKESDLVKVKLEDCSYEGEIKPSSEKRIHAACYLAREEVNFIIHTHQNYATAISIDKDPNGFAPICGYGLPGTKGLKKKVIQTINQYKESNSFLFARHGAILLGKDYEEAFKLANDLEQNSKSYFDQFVQKKETLASQKPYLDDYAQMFGYQKDKPLEDDQKAIQLIQNKNNLAFTFATYKKCGRPMGCFDVMIQNLVYKKKYSKLK